MNTCTVRQQGCVNIVARCRSARSGLADMPQPCGRQNTTALLSRISTAACPAHATCIKRSLVSPRIDPSPPAQLLLFQTIIKYLLPYPAPGKDQITMCDKHWIKWKCANCLADLPTSYWKVSCSTPNCSRIKKHVATEYRPAGWADSCKNRRCQT